MVKSKFDTNIFKSTDECAICLEKFDEESEVTPLPCDIRHYFHNKCIEDWFKNNNTCPLCKKVISENDMDKLAKEIESL